MNANVLNFGSFVTQFMANHAKPLVYQPGQVQVYALSIACAYIKAPVPLFRADYSFLLLFSNGGGRQQVDHDVFELAPNDVLFIREGHLNAIKSIDPSTQGYYIHLDSVILNQVFDNKAVLNRFSFHPKHTVSGTEMEWLCNCSRLIAEQKESAGSCADIEISLLRAIVLKLAQSWPRATGKPDRQSEITMVFKELLYENFRQRRDLGFYARALAVSENYLNRCVNKVTRKPPKQHINELLINHGKVLLQDLSKDIAQVAFELNFSDPSYFGRLFKQLTKLTPTQYRNQVRQDLSGQK